MDEKGVAARKALLMLLMCVAALIPVLLVGLAIQNQEPADPYLRAAKGIERVTGHDVLILRKSERIVSMAIMLPAGIYPDELFATGDIALQTLMGLADEETEFLVITIVNPPQEGDPRYPLYYGIMCEVEGGKFGRCRTYRLHGGYLSPDSVWWPGMGQWEK